MHTYTVNVDIGIDFQGKHYPLGSPVEMSPEDAKDYLAIGWLVVGADQDLPFMLTETKE